MFPSVHEKLLERSIATSDAGFMLAQGDPQKEITFPPLPTFDPEESYWIPRHEMAALLREAVDDHNDMREKEVDEVARSGIGKIDFHSGVS